MDEIVANVNENSQKVMGRNNDQIDGKMPNPVNYGYFTWKSQKEMNSIRKFSDIGYSSNIRSNSLENCAKRISVQNVQDCLLMDHAPPTVQDIDTINNFLAQKPAYLSKGPRQFVNFMERPHAYTDAIPLYVAQQRGCQLDRIDFLFSGSMLGVLCDRALNRETDIILLQLKKGILIARRLPIGSRDQNDEGHKFERLISDGSHSEKSDLLSSSIIREVCIGNYRLLISAEVDGTDDKGNLVEAKLSNFLKNSSNDRLKAVKAKKLLLQMLSNGSQTVVMGNGYRIYNGKGSYRIESVQKYSVKDVMQCVLSQNSNEKHYKNIENAADIFKTILDGLNDLKEMVNNGTISDRPNCFYQMTFKNLNAVGEKNEIIIEPISMKGTVEYCSQYLYEALIGSKWEQPRNLALINSFPDLFLRHIDVKYKVCECKDNNHSSLVCIAMRESVDISVDTNNSQTHVRKDFHDATLQNPDNEKNPRSQKQEGKKNRRRKRKGKKEIAKVA